MIPLTVVGIGEEAIVKKVGGKPEIRRHLENLGFVIGSGLTVICQQNGNIIVKIKESRIAISKEMACKIYV
ncbi:MAG: ferrous iron transport protein A [Eubacterium sp.]